MISNPSSGDIPTPSQEELGGARPIGQIDPTDYQGLRDLSAFSYKRGGVVVKGEVASPDLQGVGVTKYSLSPLNDVTAHQPAPCFRVEVGGPEEKHRVVNIMATNVEPVGPKIDKLGAPQAEPLDELDFSLLRTIIHDVVEKSSQFGIGQKKPKKL